MTINRCSKTASKIFELILSLFKNLIVLNFYDVFPIREYSAPLYYLNRKSYVPSTLIKLKINVEMLTDCLYLLDGPLVCLSTLIINVSQIYHPYENIDPTVNIISMIMCREKKTLYQITNYSFYFLYRKNFRN